MEADLFGTDWRALFLINLPVGVFALVLGAKVLPDGAPLHAGLRLDGVGTAAARRPRASCWSSRSSTAAPWAGRPGSSAAGWPPCRCSPPSWCTSGRGCGPVVRRSSSSACCASAPTSRGVVFTLVFFGSIVGFSLTIGPVPPARLGLRPRCTRPLPRRDGGRCVLGSGVGAWAATAVGRPILHVGLMIMAAGSVVLWLSLRAVDGERRARHPGARDCSSSASAWG